MEVTTVARQMRERLGHERGDGAEFLGHGAHHPAEEGVPVSGGQAVGIGPVDLELAVGIFVVVGVRIPAELLHVAQQLGGEVEIAVEGAQVVTGLAQRIERVERLEAARVGPAGQDELRLDARLQYVALLARLGELALQDGSRAVGPRLPVDGHVAGDPGDVGTPGQDGQAVEIGHGEHVRLVRPLAHVAGPEAGEPGAARGHVFQMRRGHDLGLGRARHFHERAEEELDALVLHHLGDVLYARHGMLLLRQAWREGPSCGVNAKPRPRLFRRPAGLRRIVRG